MAFNLNKNNDMDKSTQATKKFDLSKSKTELGATTPEIKKKRSPILWILIVFLALIGLCYLLDPFPSQKTTVNPESTQNTINSTNNNNVETTPESPTSIDNNSSKSTGQQLSSDVKPGKQSSSTKESNQTMASNTNSAIKEKKNQSDLTKNVEKSQDVNLPGTQTALANKSSISVYNFGNNSSEILQENQQLETLYKYLIDNPSSSIKIIGHTDNVGDPDLNDDLSRRRATAVYNYLVNKGVAKNRLETSWKGELEPIADNNTLNGRAQNRRVDYIINN